MSLQEASGYCDYCQRPVLGRRDGPNHILHFLITMFTCGLWVIVWILTSMSAGDYACPTCGGKIRVGGVAPVQG